MQLHYTDEQMIGMTGSQAGCIGMDTGLTRPNGSLRPSYTTFKKYLARFDK